MVVKVLINNASEKRLFRWTLGWPQFSDKTRPDSSHQSLVINRESQITCHQSHAYSAWVTTRSAIGCGATALFTGLFEVGQADHTENKGLYYRKRKGWPLDTNKNIAFSHYWIQNQHFLGQDSTMRCRSVCVVLHKKFYLTIRNFTVQTLSFRSPSFKSTLSAYWACSGHQTHLYQQTTNCDLPPPPDPASGAVQHGQDDLHPLPPREGLPRHQVSPCCHILANLT